MEVKDVKDFQDEIQYCPVGRLAKALKADALAPERLRYKIVVMVFFKRSDDLLYYLVEYLGGEPWRQSFSRRLVRTKAKRQMSGGQNRWTCKG
ncbi:hypothetical protein GE21DRAFT_1006440 [Neurospora crassa]|nr:hypothetical protein GE21DRAFT_1006440 [Neurospora crassa]